MLGGLGGFDDSLYDDRAGQVPCQRQVQEVNRLPQVGLILQNMNTAVHWSRLTTVAWEIQIYT